MQYFPVFNAVTLLEVCEVETHVKHPSFVSCSPTAASFSYSFSITSVMVMTKLMRDSAFPKQSKVLLTAVITDVAKSSASLQ